MSEGTKGYAPSADLPERPAPRSFELAPPYDVADLREARSKERHGVWVYHLDGRVPDIRFPADEAGLAGAKALCDALNREARRGRS